MFTVKNTMTIKTNVIAKCNANTAAKNEIAFEMKCDFNKMNL